MVENGPRPAQKHQDDGSLFMPISSLLPSLQIGAGAGVIVEDDVAVAEPVEFVGVESVDEGPVEDDMLGHVPAWRLKISSSSFYMIN